jgi:hypothetical protein
MKNEFELKIASDGTIETIYQDGLEEFTKEMGGEVAQVCRASNVEFEIIGRRKGWSVRAAHDPELAIRLNPELLGWGPSRRGNILLFETREEALKEEVRFFWQLLEKGKSDGKGS